MTDTDSKIAPSTGNAVQAQDELPVVARLVVEIRSDGTRTIARGAIEDRENGQNVGVEVRGETPMQLALSLARSLFDLPALARGLRKPDGGGEQPSRRRRLPWSRRPR